MRGLPPEPASPPEWGSPEGLQSASTHLPSRNKPPETPLVKELERAEFSTCAINPQYGQHSAARLKLLGYQWYRKALALNV